MAAIPPPKEFGLQWQAEYGRTRMRWMFVILGRNKSVLTEIKEELAKDGHRLYSISYHRSESTYVFILAKLAQFNKEQLQAEILRVHRSCARRGAIGLDDVDVEELHASDLERN
ncbi:MAG: hypothetical protein IPP83_09685 [Flavobacteriales bacterium]|nr:hypothetical protein [Flavobacteriales bacterium]